jgi:Sec-independent protein secretion pathway component TatC
MRPNEKLTLVETLLVIASPVLFLGGMLLAALVFLGGRLHAREDW